MTKNDLKQYSIPCSDAPGTLAKIAAALGKSGINIASISTMTVGNMAYVSFTAQPEEKVEQALKSAGYTAFFTNVIAVSLPNKPGELGKVCQTLSQEGVNIQNVYGCTNGQSESTLIFTVNDYQKAKKVLEGFAAVAA
jgi:hypothetical protein